MSRRIVVVQGHPDPDPNRLCRALADAYAEGAREAGHAVTRIDLAALDFPLLRTQAAFEHEPVPETLRPAQEAIVAADHIVIIFPLWLGTMPALVKAFLEQVMRPGVAFAYQEKGTPKLLLTGRSARLVVTMGMPAFVYRWWYFAHGLKGLERNILRFVGIKPVRETLFGMVGTASEATRRKWLKRMRDLGALGA
ncbi:NAD(P)H-dependent oxidoreductase [Azospirillum soli]|uniref:NAD(P)H-dependent oxidoreductase n=1 Tax=Azospirillum soli TaxID=1304799 RepID=UPI001AE479D8|nr:NAD(P)H-dependent oxidoreductase [Azospirillum soli]MBP2314887.1 putative NADPH-quinone reductase [Azospirillum soli]